MDQFLNGLTISLNIASAILNFIRFTKDPNGDNAVDHVTMTSISLILIFSILIFSR